MLSTGQLLNISQNKQIFADDPVQEDAMRITGYQIRAARALLRWSAQQLADRAKVPWIALQRMESTDEIPSSGANNLFLVKATLERAGIEFIDAAKTSLRGGLGVRHKIRPVRCRPAVSG